ncbi:MAG: 2-dehydropantoate 2-reductase [Acidobacteria bacterium]|nr:2-dehydropantoate 2-reductase [Acidobacteriota bacterium]MBV9474584.1 2-dehydropantoate 2-reductase [Acidobacteriota bacterium]
MKIAVLGCGGVGGYFGGRLAHAGVDTTFIARGAMLDALRTRGLRVDSIAGDFTLDHVNATDDAASVGPVDAVLVTVKAWQIPEAAAQLAPLIGEDTAVVPLENGIDSPTVLANVVGREHVLGGLCAIVSFIVEPGHIRHIAYEPTVMFGELDNARSARADRLLEAFVRAGVKAEIPPDIHQAMWTKFLFIAPMSGIGALTRVPIGQWRIVPGIRDIVTASLEEVVALAAAHGVDLGSDAVARIWATCDAMPPESTSSLQRDVLAGRPSELEAQLGAIVRLGVERGVATPATNFIYQSLVPQEMKARQA